MKRKKRKQLKEDELVTTVNKIVLLLKKRAREIIALGIIVLFCVLIFIGVRFVRAKVVKKESQLFTQILKLNSELNDNPENVGKLEELAGNGKFSRLSYVFLATYWVENGDLDKAVFFLEKIEKNKKDLIYYKAQDLLAQIHFKDKNYDKAIDIYQKIEEENPKEYSLDVVLFHQAEIYEEKGEIEEALALYKKVQEEFSQTAFGFDANQKINKLEEKR